MLRKFYGSTLYDAENELSLDEINTLQDRKKDNTHSSYFMENLKIHTIFEYYFSIALTNILFYINIILMFR